MGTPSRAGRREYGPRVRSDIWPPLRPTRLRHERGSVGVVLPGGLSHRRTGMRTIGLDVHKRFAEVAILKEGERLVRRGVRVDATPAALRAFAATLGPNDQVVLRGD